jgi:hypothetical protein
MLHRFGLNSSSVTKEFVEQSQKPLKDPDNPSPAVNEFLAIFGDLKSLAREQIIIALLDKRSNNTLTINPVQP